MQPTVRSQTRLKRLVWLLSLLLAVTFIAGGFHTARLRLEVRAVAAALESARRELIEARRAAEAAVSARRTADAKARAAESARADLAAKLKAAEAARAETEAKLNAVTDNEE